MVPEEKRRGGGREGLWNRERWGVEAGKVKKTDLMPVVAGDWREKF